MTKSLWGDWLPKMVAAFNAADPTPEEKTVLARAAEIRTAHAARLEAVRRQFSEDFRPIHAATDRVAAQAECPVCQQA